jgi:hypothetical protein
MGSYENWTRIVGGILDVAKMPGFLQNRDGAEETDEQVSCWVAFFTRWLEDHGEYEKDGYEESGVVGVDDLITAAKDCVPFELGRDPDDDRGQRIRLGFALRKRKGRVYALAPKWPGKFPTADVQTQHMPNDGNPARNDADPASERSRKAAVFELTRAGKDKSGRWQYALKRRKASVE